GILGGTTRRWRNSTFWYCCPSTTYYGFYLAKFADFFRRKRAPLSQRTLRRKKSAAAPQGTAANFLILPSYFTRCSPADPPAASSVSRPGYRTLSGIPRSS